MPKRRFDALSAGDLEVREGCNNHSEKPCEFKEPELHEMFLEKEVLAHLDLVELVVVSL